MMAAQEYFGQRVRRQRQTAGPAGRPAAAENRRNQLGLVGVNNGGHVVAVMCDVSRFNLAADAAFQSSLEYGSQGILVDQAARATSGGRTVECRNADAQNLHRSTSV